MQGVIKADARHLENNFNLVCAFPEEGLIDVASHSVAAAEAGHVEILAMVHIGRSHHYVVQTCIHLHATDRHTSLHFATWQTGVHTLLRRTPQTGVI